MNRILLTVVITTIAIVIGFAAYLQQRPPKQVENLVIAVPPVILSAPLFIAQDKGFFAKEGISVTLKYVATETMALDAAAAGNADLAASSETPIMLASLSGIPVKILATISDSDHDFGIIIRHDKKSSQPKEIRGARVGIAPGTAGRFFLDSFLSLNGMVSDDVKMVHLKEDDLAAAFAEQRIDAACTRNPILFQLKQKFGNSATVYYSDWMYTITWNIVAGRKFLRERPQTAEKVVRALLGSADYIHDHPQESQEVVARYLRLELPLITSFWEGYHFEVSLDQALLLTLEEQARWAMKTGQGGGARIPNYANFVYPNALDATAPENITFIHRTPNRAN